MHRALVCNGLGVAQEQRHRHEYKRASTKPVRFTPTSGSWLNMVEIFFSIITRQAIRRGTFTSVKDLIGAIETFIDGWNERCASSSGPNPPTKSSQALPAVKELQCRDTRVTA